MSGNEVTPASSGSALQGQTSDAKTGHQRADAIWLCPAVVCLTAAEIAAALYAFSDLVDDAAEPTAKAVGEELSFVVARYGTVLIESTADCIARGRADLVFVSSGEIDVEQSHRPSGDRLTRCQQQSLLFLGARAAKSPGVPT